MPPKRQREHLRRLQVQGKKFMEVVDVMLSEQAKSWPDIVYTQMFSSLHTAYQSLNSTYKTLKGPGTGTKKPSSDKGSDGKNGDKPKRVRNSLRCNDCTACKTEDCGECNFCLDKPKFGGKGLVKKPCSNRPPCLVKGKKKLKDDTTSPSTSQEGQDKSMDAMDNSFDSRMDDGIFPTIEFLGICEGYNFIGRSWTPLGSLLQERRKSGINFDVTGGFIKILKSSFYNLTMSAKLIGHGEAQLYAFKVDPKTGNRKDSLLGLPFSKTQNKISESNSKQCAFDAEDCIGIWGRTVTGSPHLTDVLLNLVEL